MLCAGSIREKNVKNVLLWNLLDSAGGAFGFWSVGYAFAYGGDDPSKGKTFIGNKGFFLSSDVDLEFWYAYMGYRLTIQKLSDYVLTYCALLLSCLCHFYNTGSSSLLSPALYPPSWQEPSQKGVK